MNTLNKQPLGTIGAFRHDKGIAMGIYGKGNCVSLEYDEKTKKNVLLINDSLLDDIEIKHVDPEWNPKANLNNNFLASIIDNLEDWLDEKGVRIPNEERDMECGAAEEPQDEAHIWGKDFDHIMEMLRDACESNGIIVDDKWED